mgnify:CR=1 FL=1
MKKLFLFGGLIFFLAQIVALAVFAAYNPDVSQDTVAVNEAVQTVTRDFENMSAHVKTASPDYAVLDNGGAVLYKSRPEVSDSINEAIAHRDTVLDVVRGGETVGKIIIYNGGGESLAAQKQVAVAVIAALVVSEGAVCLGYALYIRSSVIKPFGRLKGFAERVAGGNLDIPLEMDRRNVFGAFTESFDIMRSELKKARLAEAQAERSKKELVAKLSHDIKTPVASIKAVAEVGLAVAKSPRDTANYTQVIAKADQINSLVTNLFTATLEELQQLTVTPAYIHGNRVKGMLENADYLHRALLPEPPDGTVYADALRLQQVFDNVFANSYKYAGTDISVTVNGADIIIEDFGGGVPQDELAVIKEKFRRGANSAGIEGAGLGLYIADYFMTEMGGALVVENGEHGLKVTVKLRKN